MTNRTNTIVEEIRQVEPELNALAQDLGQPVQNGRWNNWDQFVNWDKITDWDKWDKELSWSNFSNHK